MKVICASKTINLDKFDKIEYGATSGRDGYCVDAVKEAEKTEIHGDGAAVITSREEIAKFKNENDAKNLYNAIVEAWINDEPFFNTNRY